jgi:hypothetical protein
VCLQGDRYGQNIAKCDKILYVFVIVIHKVGAVGIATGSAIEGLEFESRYVQEFSLLHIVQTGPGSTQPLIQWVSGTLSPGGKAVGS